MTLDKATKTIAGALAAKWPDAIADDGGPLASTNGLRQCGIDSLDLLPQTVQAMAWALARHIGTPARSFELQLPTGLEGAVIVKRRGVWVRGVTHKHIGKDCTVHRFDVLFAPT